MGNTAKHFSTEPQGVPSNAKMPDALSKAYVIIVLILCSLPLFGLMRSSETVNSLDAENPTPTFMKEGLPNADFLRELGSYYENHMPLRNEMISIDSLIRSTLFGVSNTSQVIVGRDGWIYYGGTLKDYLGSDDLTDRELDNIAFNLSLISSYARSQGAQFLFAVAPNKNTVYPEHMPSWLLPSEGPHASERLVSYLQRRNVSYADLQGALIAAKTDELYFKRDSHWNDRGALLAYNTMMDVLGKGHERYETLQFVEGEHAGDIDAMLYPVGVHLESVPTPVDEYEFSFLGADDDVTANVIETSGGGEGSLLMYRDSFANNLIQPLSTAFERSFFTNLVPYDLRRIEQLGPSVVIIERAERHLSDLDRNIPILISPGVALEPEAVQELPCEIEVGENGPLSVVSGAVDPSAVEGDLLDADTDFFVQVVSATQSMGPFVAFRATVGDGSSLNPYGFQAFIPTSSLPAEAFLIRVIGYQFGIPTVIAQMGMNQEG